MSTTGYYSSGFHTYEFDCASVPKAFIPTRMLLGLESSSLTIFGGELRDPENSYTMQAAIKLTASGTVHASISVHSQYGQEYTAVGETSSLPSTTFVGGTGVA